MPDLTKTIDLVVAGKDKASGPLATVPQVLRNTEKAAASAAVRTRGLTERVMHLGGAFRTVSTAVGVAYKGVRGLLSLNQQVEEASLRIAGSFKALGLADTFTEAQKQASSAFDIIEARAAALPGEMEDYLLIFERAMPKAVEVGAGSIEQIADLTSKFGAVMIASGVDAQQAGMDLFRMLSGQAGADVRSFQSLLPVLAKLEGGAVTTAKAWNALDPGKRVDMLRGALGKYGDLLGAFGDTASALEGTLTSQVKAISRVGMAGLFSGFKGGLLSLSKTLDANMGSLKSTAESVGLVLSSGISSAVVVASKLWGIVAPIGRTIYDGLVGPVSAVIGEIAAALGAGGAVGGALGALTGGGGLHAIVASVGGALEALTPVVRAALEVIASMAKAVGNIANSVLPGLTNAFDILVPIVSDLATTVIGVVREFVDVAAPIWDSLATAVGDVAQTVAMVLGPTLSDLGGALKVFKDGIWWVTLPLRGLAWTIQKVIEGIARATAWLTGNEYRSADDVAASAAAAKVVDKAAGAAGTVVDKAVGFLGSAYKKFQARDAAASKAAAAKAAESTAPDKPNKPSRGGGRNTAQTYNDFRGSRFDVRQDFAREVSGERVAVAFIDEMRKAADKRTTARGQLVPSRG